MMDLRQFLMPMRSQRRLQRRTLAVPRRIRRRPLRTERLETRRLLAVSEGDVFSLPRQTLDPVGLVGNVSASIRWGDGTETAVPVSTPSVANKIRFKFNYALDKGFFNAERKQALEAAGRSVAQYFTDELAAINPSGSNTWTANVCHPSQGASNQLCGTTTDVSKYVKSVAANEIVVFAGARNIIGNVRGTGGVGGYSARGTPAWVNTVGSRGQSGAISNPQTDIGLWGGSITFDKDTNWYTGKDIDGIGPDQVDFRTVAAHELLHVLGFGLTPGNKTSSWERLTPGSTFRGNQAKNAYIGSGFAPVATAASGDGPAKSHWSKTIKDQGQLTLMRAEISLGERQSMTRLDLAAMDDLGWQVKYPTSVVVNATDHVYGDNATYDAKLVLRGSVFGEVTKAVTVQVNNVAPTLTVPPTQTVMVGETLTLPESLFEIVDPGYGTSKTDPPAGETFTYTIDWKDGSDTTTGQAKVTQVGNASRDTIASFSASHAFAQSGNYQVNVTVKDDDGDSDSETFTVQVVEPPSLNLSLSQQLIAENAGDGAATLTVTRDGPTKDADQTITLSSSDTGEATVPTNVVIKAGATSATVPVDAIDDALLDGTQRVTLTASATGVNAGTVELSVTDVESLIAEVTAGGVRENDFTSVSLTVQRSNTDTNDPLTVVVSGGDASQLEMPNTLRIEAGTTAVTIPLKPIDDDNPELTQRLAFTFTADNYQEASVEFDLWDDELPLFQNAVDRFDVDGLGTVTSGDALRVINVIGQRDGDAELDPGTEQPNGVYVDVTGDYRVTTLDALQVINEIARRLLQSESEFVGPIQDLELPLRSLAAKLDDDETLTTLALDVARIF